MSQDTGDKRRHAPATEQNPSPPRQLRKTKQEERLDRAISETFPASDPVAAGHPTGDEGQADARTDREAPLIDKNLVEELAKGVRRTTR